MSPAITFLIVDDFPAARERLRQLIESAPFWQVVGEARDGHEAIRKAQDLHPHVILLDVAMPGINGIQAAKAIKKRLPQTHIIMYTAYDAPLIAQRALTAGVDAHFDKSELDRASLIALIEQWFPISTQPSSISPPSHFPHHHRS